MFGYSDDLVERFPTIYAGVVHAVGVRGGPSPKPLREAFASEQRAVAARLAETPIADHPSIAAWRRVFTAFGTKPTQSRNAAEALLRRLAKQGDIPSINALVDVGNLVAIRHALPVAVFDLAGVTTPITVRPASGSEPFTDLRSREVTLPDAGEVVFVDASWAAIARRWCWKQGAQGATGEGTTEVLAVIEAHHATAREDVEAATADLVELLGRYQPGSRVTADHLSATQPAFAAAPGSGTHRGGAFPRPRGAG